MIDNDNSKLSDSFINHLLFLYMYACLKIKPRLLLS